MAILCVCKSTFAGVCTPYGVCMYEQTKILKIRKVLAGELTIIQSVLCFLHGDLMMYRSF